jgi:NAD(P)-dependent dehydrogenase (short-subunit alcohol dehydrogenase family)
MAIFDNGCSNSFSPLFPSVFICVYLCASVARAALITGASRGLGRAVAEELARRGYSHLGLGCRKAVPGSEFLVPGSQPQQPGTSPSTTLGALSLSKGNQEPGTVWLCGDLSDPTVPDRLVREFLEFSGGRLDLLVNNAGAFTAGLVVKLTESDWDRQVAVNLSAPFRMMRAAAAALAASRGAVVNVSSLVGFHGGHGAAAYSAAKSGLEALTRAAAVEWGGAGVRVNAVIPGFLADTDMGRESSPEYVEEVLAASPLGRAADVAGSARVIAELADLPAVTGQVFSLEGRCGRPDAPPFVST